MIASRYGAVPVVRETGGLYDSIKPYRYVDGKHIGNGFTFASYNAHDMLYVLREALATYQAKQEYAELTARVMKCDFSWNTSARKYADLYNSLTPERRITK
jgi:starch synthase